MAEIVRHDEDNVGTLLVRILDSFGDVRSKGACRKEGGDDG
jgi:hypothetical protein